MSAVCGATFACASMDADAWTSMLYFAKRVLSAAMSVSTIRPFAASKLVCVRLACSNEKFSRDVLPPFSALSVAMFSNAFVKKLVPTSARFLASAEVILANEKSAE